MPEGHTIHRIALDHSRAFARPFAKSSIHPNGRPSWPASATVTPVEWAGLWETLVVMQRAGVDAGRIMTVDPGDETVADGRTRYVYKQDRCARCGSPIRRWDLAGRWAYACETCQPPP
ncbi:MAG: hypothetical protein M0Z30_03335 [Actinomycetota bacterium]|nr:hypothetical protein [Actinomycetota bacterium]